MEEGKTAKGSKMVRPPSPPLLRSIALSGGKIISTVIFPVPRGRVQKPIQADVSSNLEFYDSRVTANLARTQDLNPTLPCSSRSRCSNFPDGNKSNSVDINAEKAEGMTDSSNGYFNLTNCGIANNPLEENEITTFMSNLRDKYGDLRTFIKKPPKASAKKNAVVAKKIKKEDKIPTNNGNYEKTKRISETSSFGITNGHFGESMDLSHPVHDPPRTNKVRRPRRRRLYCPLVFPPKQTEHLPVQDDECFRRIE